MDKSQKENQLVIVNKELVSLKGEKKKRAEELIVANRELAFQNKEKDKRADQLILANEEKEKRVDELALAANVFALAGEGIFITDALGTVIDVNNTFTTTTGYSREELIGQNPRILQSDRQVLREEGFWSGEV